MNEQAQIGLEALLRLCTVRVGPEQEGGTGSFVAIGLILTCAHVVESARSNDGLVDVYWNDRHHYAQVEQFLAGPYPDLALLSVDLSEHPCVLLDEAISDRDIGTLLYSYGYPDDYRNGNSATFEYEGPTRIPSRFNYLGPPRDPELLTLKGGQARPGLSGSPLLNRRTGGVIGIVKNTRARDSDLGGRAIPASTVLSEFRELPTLQKRFHQQDARWARPLPQLDQDDLRAKARECFSLLRSIQEANARVLARIEARRGDGYERLADDNYNEVCKNCEDIRQHRVDSDDPYFDTVCNDPDILAVCTRKWYLGERLQEYEDLINRQATYPEEHALAQEDLARYVSNPPLSPRELDRALFWTKVDTWSTGLHGA